MESRGIGRMNVTSLLPNRHNKISSFLYLLGKVGGLGGKKPDTCSLVASMDLSGYGGLEVSLDSTNTVCRQGLDTYIVVH